VGTITFATDVVTKFDAREVREVPSLFVAVTVKEYAVPVFSPFTVIAKNPFGSETPIRPTGLEYAV
jgi:hypothetical protein